MRAVAWTTALLVLVSVLRSMSEDAAEIYAERVYVPLSHVLAPFAAAIPGSWSIVAMAAFGVVLGVDIARRRGWRSAVPVAIAALSVWTAFVGIWGFHYQRAPLEVRLGLEARAGSAPADNTAVAAADLAALAAELATVVSATEPAIAPDGSERRAVVSLAAAMEALTVELDGAEVRVSPRVKILPGGTLLAFGSSGVISPWLLEAHVDGGLPAPARIAVAAHELAHLAGFAREDEAEAVGAIAGLRADDPYARYSVALFQLAALARDLPPAAAASLMAELPERAREDLAATRRAAAAHRVGWLDAWRRVVYDRYLRSQGVGEGVESYAAGTRLLARLWISGAVSFR